MNTASKKLTVGEKRSATAAEIELARQILGGDTEAFEKIVAEHSPLVFSIVGRHVPPANTDDTAQEVFIRAFKSLASFRGECPLAHWISRIAVRTCYDFWRQTKRRHESSISEELFALLDSGRSWAEFAQGLADERLHELLAWAMEKLSAEDRMIVGLLYLEERSERESAELLGWSVAKVKGRAFRARLKLRGLLKELTRRTQS